jgi:hypothetical protein
MVESEWDSRSEDIKQFEAEKARRVANVERNRSLTTEERNNLIHILSDLSFAKAARIKDRALDLSIWASSKKGGLTATEVAEQERIRRIQLIWELTGKQNMNASDQSELRRLLGEEKRDQTPIRDPGNIHPSRMPSVGLISGGQDVKATVAQSLPGLPHSLGRC